MIVVVCGPPGVGKTTIATRLRDRLASRGWEFSILHSDDFSSRPYDRMFEFVAHSDADWILDGTFYKRQWQERARALGARFVRVTASLETALERNRTRSTPISERGVYVVHAEFADLDADLVVDTDDLTVEQAVDAVESAVRSWRQSSEGAGVDDGAGDESAR